MNSEIKIVSPGFKVTIAIGICLTILVIILALTFRSEFSIILLSFAGTIVLFGVVTTIGKVSHLLYAGRISKLDLELKKQDLRLATYKADRAGLEAYVLSFSKNERIVTMPGSPIQVIEAIADNSYLLPPTTQEPQLDLMTVFTQVSQSYAIIGGQQTGKTYQSRHIAAYWLNRGIKPVVVGPKWDTDEWTDCHLFGGQGNFSEVRRGIEIVRQEAGKRHADTSKSHKQHSILPVFFDDWTPIVDAVDNARELVLQATTLYASVNIVLYFILHSDTANAWGVDKKGAALKDNFVKLLIIPSYNSDGLIVRDQTRGVIKFPGDNQEYPVKLFNGPISYISDDDILEQDVSLSEVIPADDRDNRIIELYRAGESLSSISHKVYGYRNQAKLDQIKRVLGLV